MSKTLTKAALLIELETCRVIIDQQRATIAAFERKVDRVKVTGPNNELHTSRPVVVMTLDRAWAFKARNQLAKRQLCAVQRVVVQRNGVSVPAYAVY